MPPTSNDNLSVELEILDGKATAKLNDFKGNLVKTEIEASRLGTTGSSAFEKLGGKAASAVPPLQLAKGQAQQLSFQINDIASGLAMGQSPFQIMAQQGGQVVQVFGGLNGTLAATRSALAAVNLSLAGLGVFAAIAAAGVAVVKISENIRTEAEKRLKIEEKIAATINKQVLDQKKLAEEFSRTRALSGERSAFGDRIDGAGNNVSRLDALKREAEKALEIERKYNAIDESRGKKPNAARADALEADILRLDESIRKASAGSGGFTSDELERNKKFFEEQAEAARKFEESVEKGKEKVKELGGAWRSALADLTQRTNSDNPFVKLFLDGEAAIVRMREQTRGLSEDLRQQFSAAQQQQNSLDLFRERANTSLSALDLRETANRFRSGGRSSRDGVVKDLGLRNLTLYEADFERRRSNTNEQANLDYIAQRRKMLDSLGVDAGGGARERFGRQLDLLDRLRPGNDRERSSLDQKVLALGSNLDPSQLDSRGREAIAAAAEREATRKESQEKEAADARREQIRLLKVLAGEEEGLRKIAEKGGKDVLEIAIKDGTANGVAVRRPTSADTGNLYGGINLVGGAGGLSNR